MTEVVRGEEGDTARFSRTSVIRNRGTAYSCLGFGCRIIFSMPCEPCMAISAFFFIKMF